MITTTKSINLAQLDAELNAGGLNMDSLDGTHTISAVDEAITDIQLQAAVDAHIPEPVKELTVLEKLDAIGVTIADLKKALGL